MKIILAYSGGLDTSTALKWLQQNYNAEIIAYCANIGQSDDLAQIEIKALKSGASHFVVEDLRHRYLTEFVYQGLKAGAAYEGRYLLAAPYGRPLIAERLVAMAREFGATAIAHGASGKGNDQVRFYTAVKTLAPDLKVIAPLIDWDLKSREDQVSYARKHNIDIDVSAEQPFSKDGSLWGSSTECGIVDDYRSDLPESVYQFTANPEKVSIPSVTVEIGFERGVPSHLNGQHLDPVQLIETLNQQAGEQGIGRIDLIENSLLGIKARAIYESPAGTVLMHAHRELEDLTVDRDSLHYKQRVAIDFAELVYNGLWFSPLRNSLSAFVDETQNNVTGTITVRLCRGMIKTIGRNPVRALFDTSLTNHDSDDAYHHKSGEGFSYVWSMPYRIVNKAH